MSHSARYDSPMGPLTLVASDEAVLELRFAESSAALDVETPLLRRLKHELTEYFAGTRTRFDVPVAPEGTEFQREVWRALAEIPHGETRSYGQLAERLGRPSAARAVGAANGQNPIAILVPCHRVIASSGKLAGYRWGLDKKAALLERERTPPRKTPAPAGAAWHNIPPCLARSVPGKPSSTAWWTTSRTRASSGSRQR